MLILPNCHGKPGAGARGGHQFLQLFPPSSLAPAHGQSGFAMSKPFVTSAHPDCAQLVPLRAWPKLKLTLMLEQREMLWFQALSVHLKYSLSSLRRKKTKPSANIFSLMDEKAPSNWMCSVFSSLAWITQLLIKTLNINVISLVYQDFFFSWLRLGDFRHPGNF